MIEADVKKAVKKLCKERGAKDFWPVPTGYGEKPVDVLICYRGYFIACETKRPGLDKATPAQRKFLYDVRQAGGYSIIENSPGVEILRAVFDRINRGPI